MFRSGEVPLHYLDFPLVGGNFPLLGGNFPLVGGNFPVVGGNFPVVGGSGLPQLDGASPDKVGGEGGRTSLVMSAMSLDYNFTTPMPGYIMPEIRRTRLAFNISGREEQPAKITQTDGGLEIRIIVPKVLLPPMTLTGRREPNFQVEDANRAPISTPTTPQVVRNLSYFVQKQPGLAPDQCFNTQPD